tara:strand:- start:770 stop:1282 length:513 start_codon:yes stop_codon:yes gene_type:complete
MKKFFFPFIILLTISCTSNKGVYWCGDHPCINKKEKEAYFKKNMVVEMKSAKKTDYKSNSEIERLMSQAKVEEKVRIKNEKSLSKQSKLEEKKLAKQMKLEEKRRVKEEKKLAKQIKKKKKSPIKVSDESTENLIIKDAEINQSEFSEIVEKITKKNTFKPYPDINDIPN